MSNINSYTSATPLPPPHQAGHQSKIVPAVFQGKPSAYNPAVPAQILLEGCKHHLDPLSSLSSEDTGLIMLAGRLSIFNTKDIIPQATVWKWFEDTTRGKRDHFGIHNTGNLVVTEVVMVTII